MRPACRTEARRAVGYSSRGSRLRFGLPIDQIPKPELEFREVALRVELLEVLSFEFELGGVGRHFVGVSDGQGLVEVFVAQVVGQAGHTGVEGVTLAIGLSWVLEAAVFAGVAPEPAVCE